MLNKESQINKKLSKYSLSFLFVQYYVSLSLSLSLRVLCSDRSISSPSFSFLFNTPFTVHILFLSFSLSSLHLNLLHCTVLLTSPLTYFVVHYPLSLSNTVCCFRYFSFLLFHFLFLLLSFFLSFLLCVSRCLQPTKSDSNEDPIMTNWSS